MASMILCDFSAFYRIGTLSIIPIILIPDTKIMLFLWYCLGSLGSIEPDSVAQKEDWDHNQNGIFRSMCITILPDTQWKNERKHATKLCTQLGNKSIKLLCFSPAQWFSQHRITWFEPTQICVMVFSLFEIAGICLDIVGLNIHLEDRHMACSW